MRARAIDIEVQHRHRGLIRCALSPLAGFRGTLQRCGDAMRIAHLEDIGFQIERVAFACDPCGPIVSLFRRGPLSSARLHGPVSSALMLEKLNCPLMTLGRRARAKRPKVSALPRARIRLARIEPVFAGLEFPNHGIGWWFHYRIRVSHWICV